MKISEIITETTCAGAVASVAAPMTPGTKKKDAERSVYGKSKKTESKKKRKDYQMGYSDSVGNLSYTNPVKTPMIKR